MRRGLALAAAGAMAALALALPGCQRAGVAAPNVPESLKQLPTPLPKPYDEVATPAQMQARLDAAFAQAGASGKRVVVDFGGNWCEWCRMLDATMALPEAKPFVDANFIVVPVDVSSSQHAFIDRNPEVLKRFNVGKIDGVPWLVVADAKGAVLASTDAVTDDSHQTPQQMIDWLAQYATKPVT